MNKLTDKGKDLNYPLSVLLQRFIIFEQAKSFSHFLTGILYILYQYQQPHVCEAREVSKIYLENEKVHW